MFKVNEYYDGHVKSITYHTGDCRAAVGVFAPGEYCLTTAAREIMSVINGKLQIRMAESAEWLTLFPGETFSIDAGKQFYLRTDDNTAYHCLYV